MPKCILTFFLALFLSVFCFSPAFALDVPESSGFVVDLADMISPATEARITSQLQELDKSDSTQIAVLTVPSLEGEVLDQYALKVASSWGVGQAGKDNGALLLVAKRERKVRIEVGYGLEGQLTDLAAGRIIDRVITPAFKQGNFDQGFQQGVEAMVESVRGEHAHTAEGRDISPGAAIFLVLFLVFAFLMALRVLWAAAGRGMVSSTIPEPRFSRKYKRGQTNTPPPYLCWGGKPSPSSPSKPRQNSDSDDDSGCGSGTSFGGFGGGNFGGGGASGSW